MFKGKLTDMQSKMLYDILERKGSESLSSLLKDVELEWFQTLCLGYSLINKGCIVTLDTGLGKTLIASAYMQFLINSNKSNKFILICEKSNMEQTVNKIRMYTSLRVKTTTGEMEKVIDLTRNDVDYYDVLIMTYEALRSENLTNYLVSNYKKFTGLIVDECQHLNCNDSFTYLICREMFKRFEYILMLSATPFKVTPLQVLHQLSLIDENYVGSIESYIKDKVIKDDNNRITGFMNLDVIERDILLRVIGFTRKELNMKGNYKVKVDLIEATESDLTTDKREMWRIKNNNKNCLIKLKERLGKYLSQGKRGIIYCNINENKRLLLKELKEFGLSVGIIDGTLTKISDRPKIQKDYNDGIYDVLITNITTGLDLPSDYIIFFEMTLDFKQVIGRGERGLKGQDLEIIFMIVNGTSEVSYFKQNIYDRSVYLKEVLGKENDELIEVMKQLKLM